MFTNPFLKEIARAVLVGFSASAVFVGAVLAFDIAHLRQLAFNSEHGWMAIGLLFYFCGLTFSGAQMTFKVFASWRYDDEEEEEGQGPALRPAPPPRQEGAPSEGGSDVPKIPRRWRRRAPQGPVSA